MRLVVAGGVAAVAIAAAVVILGTSDGASQPAPDAAPGTSDAAPALTVAVRAGRASRLDSPAGPVHVWRPAGYRPETAATVVYVHGYQSTADSAWTEHQLPEQFASSAVNALFIVPEAPAGARQAIAFPDLGELIRLVEDAIGGATLGPLIVLGHSGAYRTLSAWIDYPLIDTVILIDALYGELDEFRDWLGQGPARRLVLTGDDTLRWTEDYARSIPGALEIDRVPPAMALWPDGARTARCLYIRSQYGHMAQITGGVVVPMLLRLEAVELLGAAPWDHPLGALPAPDAAPARGARGQR